MTTRSALTFRFAAFLRFPTPATPHARTLAAMFFGQMRLLITLGLLLISVDILACSCGYVGIVKNKKQVDFVFKGRVSEVVETTTKELDTRTNTEIDYIITRYTFKILKNHKGLKDKKTIDILMGIGDCDVSFDKGKTYLVYAYTDSKKLHYRLADQKIEPYSTTHLCTRTKKTNLLTFWESFILWVT